MSVKTQDLVDEIRLYSNLKNNQYFTDAEIVRFANDAKDELYDILVDAGQHYSIKPFDFTLTDGAETVDLPADYYKDNLLEINPGTTSVQSVPMIENYLERNQTIGLGAISGQCGDRRYLIEDLTLRILPVANPSATAGVYRLYYTPILKDLDRPITVDLSITPDITVAAMTSFPVAGDWNQVTPDFIQHSTLESDPPFAIDGHVLMLDELVFIQSADAPISDETMGIWQYTGLATTGGDLIYNFQRPAGYVDGSTVPAGLKIFTQFGNTNRQTVKKTSVAWSPAESTTGLSNLNYTFIDSGNNFFVFANEVFTFESLQSSQETSWIDGQIYIQATATPGPNDNLFYTIAATPSTHIANVTPPPGHGFTEWVIYQDSIVTVTFADRVYELPQIFLPWKLYIVVHASRTIRQARQQGVVELEQQLAQLKNRITKLAANRNENVTRAPYLRRNRRGFWGGGGP